MAGEYEKNNLKKKSKENPKINDKINNQRTEYRQRMKKRYAKNGLDSFEFHEMLEFILHYSKSRTNTDRIADDLKNKFGESLSDILEADENALKNVKGVSEDTVLFLKLLNDVNRKCNIERTLKPDSIVSSSVHEDYLVAYYTGISAETLIMLSLNNRMERISTDVIYIGSVSSSKVDMYKMVKTALNNHAAGVIIAHNHPKGQAYPSTDDIETTRRISQVFRSISINFIDHYVVAEAKISSIKDKLISDIFESTDSADLTGSDSGSGNETNNLSVLKKNGQFVRPRIDALLDKAVKKSLVIVCAGMGYGKTLAVYDFLQDNKIPAIWMQFSELDNNGSRFWESYVGAVSKFDPSIGEEIKPLGFPDTEEKYNQYINLCNHAMPNRQFILVLDDVHLVNDPAVLKFLEYIIINHLKNVTTIMICRELPKINVMGMQIRDSVQIITEEELKFTKDELADYLSQQGITAEPNILHEIFRDTEGWAFSVNLTARWLKKSAGYSGYVRSAMKQNIFELMEAEVWDVISERLKHILVKFSLIEEHLSADLIKMLAGEDDGLLNELYHQNAYMRFDKYINAYLIHHLFLDFLREKQNILADGEKTGTYRTAADWCRRNGFTFDAMRYYEKIGDYESIVSVFFELFFYIPHDLARHILGILERAPAETFERVEFFAAMHLYTVMCLGRWQEFSALAEYYEQKFLTMPEDGVFRSHSLTAVYLVMGAFRSQMSIFDDRYDFDAYYAKVCDFLAKSPFDYDRYAHMINPPIGAWVSAVGSGRQGAPQEYINAAVRMTECLKSGLHGVSAGGDDLCRGELAFYRDEIKEAESFISGALKQARENNQFELIHRALFYTMRIAVLQGDKDKMEKSLKDIKLLLNEKEYPVRFITCDIAAGWYQYMLCRPDNVPSWLKEKFVPYGHAYFIENFGNQMKARWHYLTKNYKPLLVYIDEMKQRESILYGRIELLAIEACVHYKMKNIKKAFASLREAYDTANPNNILMPFIELGKDMRALTGAAFRTPDCGIPFIWLKTVNSKSAIYAKHQAMIISEYKNETDAGSLKPLSVRETEILHDLCNGLTRSEIAVNQNLSINTVKMNIKHIFEKLNAENTAEVIRIAAERKLL